MVFAYTQSAREALQAQFQAHSIDRTYVGIVEGILPEKKGSWQSYLIEDPDYFVRSANVGKLSITHYEVIREMRKLSLMRFKLETGRKNQIRVHCSEAGHPLTGDEKYGAKTNFAKRLCLHASKLGFIHPTSGKKMEFEIPVPDVFDKLTL
jgi:23S rRNA pseudouridine1911/1915/1917 synthase